MTELIPQTRLAILRGISPLTKWISLHLHMPYSKKKITGIDYFQTRSLLQPGDVLCTRVDGEFTNLFIPGFWTHCGMYIRSNMVVEATASRGVVVTDLVTFMTSKDHIAILRPIFASSSQTLIACDYAESKIGKPYDYEFVGRNEAFYCSELIQSAYNEALEGNSPFVIRLTWGEPTVVPDDIFSAKKKWDCRWMSSTTKLPLSLLE